MMVQEELHKLGIRHLVIELGSVEIPQGLTEDQYRVLKHNLLRSGLEVLDNKKSILIEKIKNVVVNMIHHSEDIPLLNYSTFISDKLEYDYTYLANIFAEVTGTTIQQFIIFNKVEKIKELLLYDELNLKQIAHKLHYSSAAHLSNQFKKITGLTPSYFRQLKHKRMQNLENV
jgi:AraC-like DNA-binding protein